MLPNQFSASLWGDEAFSAVLSQKSLWQMIKIVSRDTSPPLYYICEHFWFRLFGHSEIAIRALSFLFFLGTVATVALIAKEVGKKKTVFWATILTFLNPFLFKYAFEGRMYSILAFTTTLSFYFFIKTVLSSSKKALKWQIGYVLAVTAALYSHHFAIFAIFVQGIWSLIEVIPKFSMRQVFRKLWVYPIVALLYAPWLPSLYYQTTLVGSGFWLATPNLKDLLGVMLSFTAGPEKHLLRNLAFILIAISLIVRRWNLYPPSRKSTNISSFENKKEWSSEKTDWILLSWFLDPLLLTFIISQFFQSIFFDRYMLFVIPGITLLLATRRRNIVSPAILLALVTILAYSNFFYFIRPTKRPFKELSSYMKQELEKGGVIINWNSAAHHLWESKYYGVDGPIYSPEGPLPFYVGTAQMAEGDVIYKLPNVERLGVITSGPTEEVRLENYILTEYQKFGDLKGLWFQKVPSPSSS